MSQIRNEAEPAGPTQHALLFAWIVQEVFARTTPAQGAEIIRQAVQRYGEQRGRRMALRAQLNGQPLEMSTYMAYGEWQAESGAFASKLEDESDAPRSHIFRCPWHQAWVEQGVNEFGRLYCLDIDTSLARGFNPELNLEVNGTRSNGAAACEFIYHGANLEEVSQRQVDPRLRVMPWDYHLGHLYKTMGEGVEFALGKEGQAAMRAALERFSSRFGSDAAEKVLAYLRTDFDRLP